MDTPVRKISQAEVFATLYGASSTRIPNHIVYVVIAACVAPFLLHSFGFDFGASGITLQSGKAEGIDNNVMFYQLKGAFIHTILEWSAFLVAIITAILAFIHYRIEKDLTTPVIGMALLCAGSIDAFHTLASDRLIEVVASNQNLLPFTWAISRVFNVLIMMIGAGFFLLRRKSKLEGSFTIIFGTSVMFGLLAYAIIYYCASSAQLPETIFPDLIISRPWDVGPLILFLLCGGFIFPMFYRRYPSLFAHSLIIAVIPNVVVQLHMAFGSTALFDAHFNIAHFLKIIAYAVPLLGLVLDYIRTYAKQQAMMDAAVTSETQKNAILNTAPNGIITIDDCGVIQSFNPSAERLFGYSAHEVIGENVSMLMPEPHRQNHEQYLRDYSRTGERKVVGFTREIDGRHKNGSLFPVELSVGESTLKGQSVFTGIVRDITERKQQEQALRRSEERLRRYFDAGVIGMAITKPDRGIVQCNDKFCEILGYSQSELKTKTWAELTHPDDIVLGEDERKQVVAGERDGYTIDKRYIHKDGQIINASVSSWATRKTDGTIENLVVFIQDISDRKRAEESLQRYEKIVNTVSDFMSFIDLNYTYLAINQRYLDAFQKNREDVIGHSVIDVIGVENFNKISKPNLDKAFAGETSFVQTWSYQPAYGDRYVGMHYTPHKDVDGTVIGVIVNGYDMTESKLAEEALLESQSSLKEAQKLARLGSWEWDINKGEIFWSDQMYDIFGLNPDEFDLNRDSFMQLVHPDDLNDVLQSINTTLEKDVPYIHEHQVVLPSGEVRYHRAQGKVIRDENGRPTRFFGTAMDITELKQVESELRKANGELQRSNKELEQFAYVASHDLQEPLRMVTSYTQLLERRYSDKLDDDAREFMGYTVEGAKRMQSLITDLLKFSRVNSHEKEFTDVDCNSLCREALDNLIVSINESDTIISSEGLPVVRGEETQLRQLFQNLISNALKYRDMERQNEIHVGAEKHNGYWQFVVKDNGIGIDEKYSDRIFIIFQRLHGKSEYSGTGIGLALCKKIVERHGGEIWLKSQVGKGSEFFFTLPA